MIQFYVGAFASQLRDVTKEAPVCWILDHDKRLGGRVCGGAHMRNDRAMLSRLHEARRGGLDVLLGVDTECPPLPCAFVMRTQLVDVYHHLHALASIPSDSSNLPGSGGPDASGDYYHDVACNSGAHLETPFWSCPGFHQPSGPSSQLQAPPTASQLLSALADELPSVLLGDAVFRPLETTERIVRGLDDVTPRPSVLRGGSTFVMNPDALLCTANFAPTLRGRQCRRSDMVWASINTHVHKMKVCLAPALTVRHVRKDDAHPSVESLMKTVVDDTLGAALYRSLDTILRKSGGSLAGLTDEDLAGVEAQFESLVRQRLSALLASFFRIQGLLHCIEDISKRTGSEERWRDSAGCFDAIANFVAKARELYDVSKWDPTLVAGLRVDSDLRKDLRAWVQSLPTALSALAASREALCSTLHDFFRSEHRVACARRQVLRFISQQPSASGTPSTDEAEPDTEPQERTLGHASTQLESSAGTHLRLLGMGDEGVVFLWEREGSAVKYMDLYQQRAQAGDFQQLSDILDRMAQPSPASSAHDGCSSILPSRARVRVDGCVHKFLITNFVPGECFKTPLGGGWDFCRLIRECRALKIAIRNICPKNLVEDDDGRLHFVDLGLDVVPWTKEGDDAMVKRAFLTHAWPHRQDLSELLQRSLREDSDTELPELCGIDNFRRAVDQSATQAESDLYELVLASVRSLGRCPRRVLDYGCGKSGKMLQRVHEVAKPRGGSALDFLGYDPLVNQWPSAPEGVQFTSSRDRVLQSSGTFDLVLCLRVLCCLRDIHEVRQVLEDLRRSCDQHADVIVAVCHPAFVEGGEASPHQERGVSSEDNQPFDGRRPGTWTKRVRTTGQVRHEHYLPFHLLARELHRAGFIMRSSAETETVGVTRFLPSADYLVLHLSPTTGSADRPTASLVIRTCIMEWRTVYPCVVHLATQLEGPHAFCEIILLVDSRRNSFVRQYNEAACSRSSIAEFEKAVQQLQDEGWIDRVLWATNEPAAVSGIYTRWFGRRAASTHTSAGVPVTSSLEAFEAAQGDLVLQVDSDIMVARKDREHDFLADAHRAFAKNPACVTWSLNICQQERTPLRFQDDSGSPFRSEVRAAVWHRARLLALCPLSTCDADWTSECADTAGAASSETEDTNEIGGAAAVVAVVVADAAVATVSATSDVASLAEVIPLVGWYRLFDRAFAALGAIGASARGGGAETFFVHPLNDPIKRKPEDYLLLLDCVEKGRIPVELQSGQVDFKSDLMEDWIRGNPFFPRRSEPVVFIVCGANVPPGVWRRALASMKMQSFRDWGAVFVDNGSRADWMLDMQMVLARGENAKRITLVQPRLHRGSLANHVLAIRDVCSDPRTVVVTLDMDDCLIGPGAIARVLEAYDNQSADLTLGSMLRTDKPAPCPYPLQFHGPRALRGIGNIWQHLRTFRRALFLRLKDEDLREDAGDSCSAPPGQYFSRACDWALMLPLVEMAFRPVAIPQVLYYYEPSSAKSSEVALRERLCTTIVRKPSYSRQRPHVAVVGDASLDICAPADAEKKRIAYKLGRLLAEHEFVVVTGGMGGVMEAACRGAKSTASKAPTTIGLLPGSSISASNPFNDISIPTGMQHARNVLVSLSHAVIAIGGGAGTTSEVNLAWSQGRVVIAIRIPGDAACTSTCLADQKPDKRVRTGRAHPGQRVYPGYSVLCAEDDRVIGVDSAEEALAVLERWLPVIQLTDASTEIKEKKRQGRSTRARGGDADS